jgi:hypothetical protein
MEKYMEKTDFNKIFKYALFYGSIWGFIEATLGHALHYIPVQVSGFIMFPIALFLMQRAYRYSQSVSVFFLMGVTAALIKFADIFIPGLPIIKTLNPMLAIMYEASAVALLSFLLDRDKLRYLIPGSLAVCLLWRSVFVLISLFIDNNTAESVAWVNNPDRVFSFIIVNGLVSAVIAFGLIVLEKRIKITFDSRLAMHASLSVLIFASAAALQYFL